MEAIHPHWSGLRVLFRHKNPLQPYYIQFFCNNLQNVNENHHRHSKRYCWKFWVDFLLTFWNIFETLSPKCVFINKMIDKTPHYTNTNLHPLLQLLLEWSKGLNPWLYFFLIPIPTSLEVLFFYLCLEL